MEMRDDEWEWTRRSVLRSNPEPAIRGAILPWTDRETGNLTKKE